MKQCSVCQAVLPDEVNFCGKCGSSSFMPCADAGAAQQPAYPPYDPNGMAPADGGYPPMDGGYIPPVMPPKKKSNTLAIALGAGGGAVVLIAVIVILVTVVFNPVNRFMNKMEDGQYGEAAAIYYEKIMGNAKRNAKVYEQLYMQLEDQMQMYRDGLITYDDMMANLYGVEVTGVLGGEVYSYYEEAGNIDYCRTTYADAQAAFDTGDYENAIYFSRSVVYMEGELYSEAEALLARSTEAYRESVIAQANAYKDSAQFGAAVALIQEALYVLPDDAALMNELELCYSAEHEYTIQQMIDEAFVYAAQNDYPTALGCIEAHLQMYPEEAALIGAKNELLTAFEGYVATEGLRLAQAGEFQHAASLTASGLSYFSSARVSELHNICVSYLPVLLGEMEMFQNNTDGGSWASKTDKVDQYTEDNYGNKYAHSFSAGCGEVVYLVNFKYQTFQGNVAFPKGLDADNARSSATLTIYGDGVELLKFENMTEDSAPYSFTADIASFEKITLEWECDGYNIWEDWGYFATIFDGEFIPIPLEVPGTI